MGVILILLLLGMYLPMYLLYIAMSLYLSVRLLGLFLNMVCNGAMSDICPSDGFWGRFCGQPKLKYDAMSIF
jgi:hypothetical protein